MALRPIETTQKALISTTSHLVGEYEKDGILLALAWPDFNVPINLRWSPWPISRSAFIFAIETPPIEKQPGEAFQEYSSLGTVICAYLFPVESANPIWGLYAAITRQDRSGQPAGGWRPDQRMTREEALRSWTIEGGYAAFEETRKGSLEPGKLADFVMLSGDVMTMPPGDIWKTRVTLTVVGGKIVYQQ